MFAKQITFMHYRLGTGGIDRVACLLADGFAKAGYRVDLLLFCGQGAGEKVLRPLLGNNVNLYYLGRSRGSRTLDLLRLMPCCVRWIKQHHPGTLVSTCNNMNWITVAAAKLARSGAQTILKTTNPIVREQDNGIYAVLRKFGYAKAFAKADKILALSDAETRLLQKQFPTQRDKFGTVVNPYVTPAMLEKPRQLAKARNRKTILGIGRFESQKRFELLIKAFATMDRTDVDLAILGDGQQRPECEKLVQQLNLTDRVHMPGFVRDVTDWLHRSDVLVMTSRYEGLPAVVLEALAANCPVLTTDCFPAARELLSPLSGCGIIEGSTPSQVAQQIAQILDQPKPEGLDQIASHYSVQNGIDDHIQQVDTLV